MTPQCANRFLSSLQTGDYELLRPYLASVELQQYAVLFTTDARITRAYFPHNCLISFVLSLSNGETAAVGVVGRDGVVGSAAALGAPYSPSDALVEIPGFSSVIDVEHLQRGADLSRGLRDALFRYCQFERIMAQQSAVCLAKHSIHARLCRKLARINDLTSRTEFPMTQEFLARLLGVQRVSITLAAEQLQQAGLIKYRRGYIQIVTLQGVERAACECYETINEKRIMLLEGFSDESIGS